MALERPILALLGTLWIAAAAAAGETPGAPAVTDARPHTESGPVAPDTGVTLFLCGDVINDYEGIGGTDEFRPELALMYFPTLDPASGRLQHLEMVATRLRRFQRLRATTEETAWLAATLSREGAALGTRVTASGAHRLILEWD